jgi:hypothetical protein
MKPKQGKSSGCEAKMKPKQGKVQEISAFNYDRYIDSLLVRGRVRLTCNIRY